LLFNSALYYIIREVQDNQVGLKLTGTYQLLAYADAVKLLADNINRVKENTEALTDSSKKVGLEVYAEKTKYMLLSRRQHAGKSHDTKTANTPVSSENVA
jgi:hypothetical protein